MGDRDAVRWSKNVFRHTREEEAGNRGGGRRRKETEGEFDSKAAHRNVGGEQSRPASQLAKQRLAAGLEARHSALMPRAAGLPAEPPSNPPLARLATQPPAPPPPDPASQPVVRRALDSLRASHLSFSQSWHVVVSFITDSLVAYDPGAHSSHHSDQVGWPQKSTESGRSLRRVCVPGGHGVEKLFPDVSRLASCGAWSKAPAGRLLIRLPSSRRVVRPFNLSKMPAGSSAR